MTDYRKALAGLAQAVRDDNEALLRFLSAAHITLPASRAARAKELAKARRIYGLDLTDEERAAKIRARQEPRA